MADKQSISDEAVSKATGRSWREWFALLDSENALEMPHKEIAQHLYDKYKIPGWWAQTVTVEYERARGRREVHQVAGGYKISRSKVIEVPLATLYHACDDAKQLARWLPGHKPALRTATKNKSMRFTWDDGETVLSISFYSKGERKSQIVLEHSKLASAEDAEAKKAFWSDALGRLKQALESA